jgi:tetratricopeptide (TPR) repeat protein
MSYAQSDDDFEGGALSRFRDELSRTLRFVSGGQVTVFNEGTGTEIGQPVQGRIIQALNNARVLVPIITPSFVTDPICRDILQYFLRREYQLGRNDLVLAVYYQQLSAPPQALASDPLLSNIEQRQILDWRALRGKAFDDPQVKQELERLANRIIKILHESRIQPVSRTIVKSSASSTKGDDSSWIGSILSVFILAAIFSYCSPEPLDCSNPETLPSEKSNACAVRVLEQQGCAQAIPLFHHVIDEDPEHFEAPNRLAFCLFEQGDEQAAIEKWEQALDINPDHLDAIAGLGVGLYAVGRQDEGLDMYQQVILDKPEYRNSTWLRSNVYWPDRSVGMAQEMSNRLDQEQYEQN